MKDVTILPLERPSQRDAKKDPSGKMRVLTPRILKVEKSNAPLIRVASFTDGTSNTIAVAAVSPERKIPWTKPEDITVGREFPLEPGKPGGIAAPYSSGTRPTNRGAAPVLFADGTSSLLLDTIDPSTLYAFLTRRAATLSTGARSPRLASPFTDGLVPPRSGSIARAVARPLSSRTNRPGQI